MYLEYKGPREIKKVWIHTGVYTFEPDPDFDGRMIARDPQGDRNIPDEDARAILKNQVGSTEPCVFRVSEAQALLSDPDFRATVLGNAEVIMQMFTEAGIDLVPAKPELEPAEEELPDVVSENIPEPGVNDLKDMKYQELKQLGARLGLSPGRRKKEELIAEIGLIMSVRNIENAEERNPD